MQSTLLDAAIGTPVELGQPEVPAALRLRLAEIGIRRGQVVSAMRRTTGGGRVVAVGRARIALDRATCRSIMVTDEHTLDPHPAPARSEHEAQLR